MQYFSGYDNWKTSPPPEAPEIDHCFHELRAGAKKLDGTVLEGEVRAMVELAEDEKWGEASNALQTLEDEMPSELVDDYMALFDLLEECQHEVEEVLYGSDREDYERDDDD